jgi:hypothetical protein
MRTVTHIKKPSVMKSSSVINNTAPPRPTAALLRAYAPHVEELGLAARALILQIFPNLNTEQVDNTARVIGFGYSAKYADTVCVIMPTNEGITLGIGFGSELPDPAKLMEGTGKVHRHVKLKSTADLKNPALKDLLVAALDRRKKLGLPIS